MGKRINFNYKWLIDAYINQNLSLKEIAQIKKCGITTVSRAIQNYKINEHFSRERKRKYNFTKANLEKEYIDNKKSQSEIADLFGCDQTLICFYMKKWGIKTRTSTDFIHFKGHPMLGKENKWGNHSKKHKKKMSKMMSGKGNPMWGKELSKETRRKISIKMSGEKNPMWGKRGPEAPNWIEPKNRKNNLYQQIRNSFEGKKWTQECYLRDDYTCQSCGDDKGGNLNAHHIKHLSEIVKNNNISSFKEALSCKELWDIANGITLCEKCHIKVHTDKYHSNIPKLKLQTLTTNSKMVEYSNNSTIAQQNLI